MQKSLTLMNLFPQGAITVSEHKFPYDAAFLDFLHQKQLKHTTRRIELHVLQ